MAAAAAEVQALLRFLSQDAKVPLATALPKINELRKAELNSPEKIAKSDIAGISKVFADEKVAKQILSAAKRVSSPKKRPAPSTSSPSSKRARGSSPGGQGRSTREIEELKLPSSDASEDVVAASTIQTNRAPLVLAFAVALLKYTMPEQPLSSRLSLAQAVVSANSQSKAKSIGLVTGATAEDEGWANGQPKVKVMGREIAVMRRSGYTVEKETHVEDSQSTVQADGGQVEDSVAFWGLDLEALRKSNGPLVAGKNTSGMSGGLPIHSPQAARNYLLKSFALLESESESADVPVKSESSASRRKKVTASEIAAKKEEAAAILLQTLEMLYRSWVGTLRKEELDRRAWSWYLHVRPDVAQGQAGWGQKGEVKLADILKLRRTGP